MDYIIYLFRAIWRARWWIIIGTLIITSIVYYQAKKTQGYYNVETTLYTGVVSGYGIEENDVAANWALAQNAIENLINIIQSESTYKRVSLRLFSRILVKGNPDKDQNNITSNSYNYVYDHLKNSPDGKRLLSLINKNSEETTTENFAKYEKPDRDNYIYGLFYFQHPYFSFQALKNIKVTKIGNSDLLKVSYSASDPGIVYNTISLLMEEFVNEYKNLRYGETDKVISYFKSELDRLGTELMQHENDLTEYNVANRIINYYDETKEVAAINKEFELKRQDVLFAYNSSKAILVELERQMDANTKQFVTNGLLVDKIREASILRGKFTEMETFSTSKTDNISNDLNLVKSQYENARKELSSIINLHLENKSTKEGISRTNIIDQWLEQTLLYEKAKAELNIVNKNRQELNDKYVFYAPVGTTIKRKERVIGFSEQGYLANLQSYNEALLRKKNLEMTSSTFKVLNPAAYPIGEESRETKKITIMAGMGSFLLLVALALLIEFIDRTLRDSVRTRKLTGCPVLGSYPIINQDTYSTIYQEMATRYLSNAVLRFFSKREAGKPCILNLLNIQDGCGKSYLANQLENYWKSIGLNVKRIVEGVDFEANSPQYALADNINSFYTIGKADILIIEHPNLSKCNIPSALLQEAQLNLLVLSAHHGWKSMDKWLLGKLKSQIEKDFYIYLNCAPKYEVEDYTGMLPPFTFLRRQSYYLRQMCLTEDFFYWKRHLKSRRATVTEDDEDE